MSHHSLQDLPPEAFIRLPDVIALAGIKSSLIYSLIEKRKFPAPHKITQKASAWRMAEVRSWLADPLAWQPSKEGV